MSKNVTICLRIDIKLKSESKAVLRQFGLTTSEAIKIFLILTSARLLDHCRMFLAG